MNLRKFWKKLLVPDCEGLVHFDLTISEIRQDGTFGDRAHARVPGWLEASTLEVGTFQHERYKVSCGEVSGHGSIGFVTVESTEVEEQVWVFVSERTDPFDQVILKGGYILVLSSSGAVFRFRSGMREADCFPSR